MSSIGISDSLKATAQRAYRAMETGRAFDNKISALYKAGKIMGGVFLGRGHEAIAASQGANLTKGQDVFVPFIRENAGRFAWGTSVLESARGYFGSVQGAMRGRDGNVHWGFPKEGNPAPISHLGAMLSVVAGMMLAKKMQGITDCVGVSCTGDGTTSTGSFHEACNMIAVEKLPVVLVVTNNKYAYSTTNAQEFACDSLNDRGHGYGFPTHECDGTDFLDTLSTISKAVAAARAGEGPQWVLANTLRMCGHGEHDDAKYIPEALKQEYAAKDCLDCARRQMVEQGWLTEAECLAIQSECAELVQQEVAQAQKEAGPDVATMDWNACSWIPEQ